jgi:uncharacterized protein with PCYCGC motif
MKKLLIASLLLIVGMFVIGFWFNNQSQTAGKSEPVAQRSAVPAQDNIHMHEYAVKGRVPAFYATAPDVAVLPPTLAPELFTGNEKLAYRVAREIPQTLAQLPCYCHCDRSQNHKSLHSCFESEHGENCGICINEALMAYNLHKQGMAVSEIRKRIITAYGQAR